MSVKRAFFGIFQKFMVVCCAMFFGITHAFSANLPSGYTELEYIESTGTQYIDTVIKQQDGDEFGLVYQQVTLDTSYRSLFGAAESGQASEFYISQTSSVTYVGNISDSSIPRNTNKHTLSWVTTSSSSQNVVVDGQTYVVSVRITPNPNLNVMVFARNASQGKMIGKVYGYYQKRNGEYLINLVPAKNSSGVIGMYDTVNNRFYTNKGTGTFTAGPVVRAPLPNEYQAVTPDNTETYPETLSGYTLVKSSNSTNWDAVSGANGGTSYYRFDLGTGDIIASDTKQISNFGPQAGISSNNSVVGFYVYKSSNGRSYISVRDPSKFTSVSALGTYFASNPLMVLYKNTTATNNEFVAVSRRSDNVFGYYCVSGTNQGDFVPAYGMTGYVAIKIATTTYNTAQFSPVVTDLNTTIATIRSVVTNTINQTKAIADLQAKKQTRPDEQCPAGKKCLLVEDNDGVPHWYEIIENVYGLPAGYTPLEYIRSSGVAYIDTGYSPTSKTRIELVAKMDSGAGNVNIAGSAISTSSGSSSDALLVINSFSDTEYEIKFGPSGTWPKGATNMTTKNTFSLSATEFRVNNVVKETYSGSVPDTGNKPFYLFQRWRPEITSTDSKVQIYEFNIYENGTLVRRMVPAKQGTTVGMYDTVGNRFYTKSGTGSLTAGPEI
jgi:hypothetical protein